MGEAKRRRESMKQLVYHHTSTLRTNLIWMSGVIQVEGAGEIPVHPKLGKLATDAAIRRTMNDFPPLVWFTRQVATPKCLQNISLYIVKPDGETQRFDLDEKMANLIAMNRVALGFSIETIGAIPWPEYYGYTTPEGQELNDTAREVGDNPDDWYICEQPVDALHIAEVYGQPDIKNPILERRTNYVNDIHKMVTLCRENKGTFIPPTWMDKSDIIAAMKQTGIPVKGLYD